MTQNSHSSPDRVPAELVRRSRENWRGFTQGILWNCIAAAGLLFFLLLVFKIL